MTPHCTRTMKTTGAPCLKPRHNWPASTGLPDPESCRRHWTDTERAAYVVYERQWDEELDRLMTEDPQAVRDRIARVFGVSADRIRVRRSSSPACWSWPAPETCTFKDDAQAEAFLYHWHNDRCAACGAAVDLVLDHDHRTALIRGYLCASCNSSEPHAASDSLLGRYRERNPASILGIQVRYWHPLYGYTEPEPGQGARVLDASPVYRLAALLARRGGAADAG